MKKSQFIIKNIKNNKKLYILPFVITASISFIISLILIVSISSIRYNLQYEDIYFGEYDAEISNLNDDQIENVRNHISVGKVGEVLDTEETTDIFSELGYLKSYDKNAGEMIGLELIDGKYPIEKNEIAIEKSSENLIKSYSISEKNNNVKNKKVNYPYTIKIPIADKNGKKEEKLLVVTGSINEIFENENWEKNIYVSKNYANDVGYKKSEIIKFKDVNRRNVIKIKNNLKRLVSDIGFDESEIKLVSRIDYIKFIFLDNLCPIVVLLAAIFIVSHIILKNINKARLYRDIKDMAILEAIGASSRQIKSIIKIQSFIMSILSVGVGVGINLLSISIMKIVSLININKFNNSGFYDLLKMIVENIKYLDVLLIFVIISAIIFLSSNLSSRKVLKNMLQMDIPSAINNPYAIYIKNEKNNVKNSGKEKKMRGYKKYTTSKTATIIIFVILAFTASIVKSIESGSRTLYKYNVDYIVRNIDMYSENKSNLPIEKIFSNVALTDEVVKNVNKIKGVESVENSYTSPAKYYENGKIANIYGLYGIDDEELENLVNSSKYNGFDIEKFKRGNVICVHRMYANELGIDKGDKLELEVLENGVRKVKTFEVINISQVSPDFGFIYQSAFDNGLARNINSMNIKCDYDKRKNVELEVKRILEGMSGNVEFVDCMEELKHNEAYISAINIMFSLISGFTIILSIFNAINGSIYEIMSQSADFGVLIAIGISDKQLETIISKKIEEKVAIPAAMGVVLGSMFVFLMSKILIGISTIKLNISTPWGLYLFIIVTAILSVKIGTKYVCNKMKKLSPTDIINNI